MTAILERRESTSLWARFCEWITSTENRIYIGWFGVIMIPTLLTATSVFIIAFIAAPPVDIDGIREPVSGSLLYGNNIISGAVIPTSNAIGLHFYPIWEAASLDEWLYNGGPYQLIVCHFFIGVCCYMGREWELSFRLGMRPWIAVAYSAPVAAATAVFIIYPIGQGSFSDGMPLGKPFAPSFCKKRMETCLNGKNPLKKGFTQLGFAQPTDALLPFGEQEQEGTVALASHTPADADLFLDSHTPSLLGDVQSQEERVCEAKPSLRKEKKNKKSGCVCRCEAKELEDNSVPNRIQPRQQSGLYMIHCLKNDWRYFGESNNVSGRLASHKSLLNRQIHPNKLLQADWDLVGSDHFQFIVLFIGQEWSDPVFRRAKELELIILNRNISYNILEGIQRPGDKNPFWGRIHTEETKKRIGDAMRGVPNNLLGKTISINNISYPSLAEASRQTSHSRKLIRKRLNDPSWPDWKYV